MLAYHVGVEVECKIAEAIAPRHYDDGFHSTGTVRRLRRRRPLPPSCAASTRPHTATRARHCRQRSRRACAKISAP